MSDLTPTATFGLYQAKIGTKITISITVAGAAPIRLVGVTYDGTLCAGNAFTAVAGPKPLALAFIAATNGKVTMLANGEAFDAENVLTSTNVIHYEIEGV